MRAAATKPKSSSNSAVGSDDRKTIDETYHTRKTQLEHILLRPDTYLGSVHQHTHKLWVYEDGAMVRREITYVPGLYKIFDEILLNSANNKQRDPSMDSLQVDIDVKHGCISVYNNGIGMPVEIHQEEGVYVPEMVFGDLLARSNCNYEVIFTNVFSTEFIIETADGRRQKKYKQVFSENMGKKSNPEIKSCRRSENWTRVTFKPDLAKFYMTHLEDDIVSLMRKRVVDMAGTLGKTVTVKLNGQKVATKSFLQYAKLYTDSASRDRLAVPSVYEKVNDRWEVCVCLSKEEFQQVNFVNRIATVKGGTHVDYVANQIATRVTDILNEDKNAKIKLRTVKSRLWVFVNALIENPAFNSQNKDTLTTRQESYGSNCVLSDDFINKVVNWGVVHTHTVRFWPSVGGISWQHTITADMRSVPEDVDEDEPNRPTARPVRTRRLPARLADPSWLQ